MTKGNHGRALRLLEDAFERDSTHIGVRIELADALFAVNGLDVFTVRAAVEHANGKEASRTSGAEAGAVCTNGIDPARATAQFLGISFKDEAIQTILEERETLRRVVRLVLDGGFRGRADAFAHTSTEVRAEGYLLAALARTSLRLAAVQEAIRNTGGRLYVDRSEASLAFIACGGTREAVARIERVLCRDQKGTGQAATWLRTRNELIGSGQTTLLIDLLETHVQALQARRTCSETTRS